MCFSLSVFLSVCMSLVSLCVDVSLYPVNKYLFGNPSSEEPGRELKAPELTAAINHSPKPASLEQEKHTPFLHACKQCICRASLNSGGKKKKNPHYCTASFHNTSENHCKNNNNNNNNNNCNFNTANTTTTTPTMEISKTATTTLQHCKFYNNNNNNTATTTTTTTTLVFN